MQTIQIHPELYTAMIDLYAANIFRKMMKTLKKSSYVMDIACRAASEFDKTHGIVNIDQISDFVTLQIVLRATSNQDTEYNEKINDRKKSLLCEYGILFAEEVDQIIDELTFHDPHIIHSIQDLAAKKMLKLLEIFDDDIVYLTRAFCKIVKSLN